ncbi:MAG: hypothetical protein PWQ95_763 [Thermococcaceae archaeon]|nr:hypothetical protein [Thermococcaceae archaeon]
MWRKKLGVLVSLILMVSLIPSYAVMADEAANTSVNVTTNQTTNVSVNAPGLQIAAENLIRNAERLANYTASLLSNATNVTPEVQEKFESAENLIKEAKAAYEEGNYKEAMKLAIEAMKAYRDVIFAVAHGIPEEENETESGNVTDEIPGRTGLPIDLVAKVESLRMNGYFRHVEALIEAAEENGANTTEVKLLLNQTREAYAKVVESVMSGNTTALLENLEVARELKRQLDDAVRELHMELLKAKAPGLALSLQKRLEVQFRMFESFKHMAGANGTEVVNLTQALNQLQNRIMELIQEGKYLEALKLAKESGKTLRVTAVQLRWAEKKEEPKWPVKSPGKGTEKGKGNSKENPGMGKRP